MRFVPMRLASSSDLARRRWRASPAARTDRRPSQPWQREHLSKRAMQFDADPQEDRFRQHWLGAREGADLGFGQPGGGCGCN